MKQFFLFMSIGIMSACLPVDDMNIDLGKLYAISCTISPQDTLLIAYLYRGQPLGTSASPESSVVTDGVITISDDTSTDTLRYDLIEERYQVRPKHVIIKANTTYFLNVRSPDGAELNATCKIPPSPELPELTGEFGDEHYFFSVRWNNPLRHQYFLVNTSADGFYEVNYSFGKQTRQLNARITDDIDFPSNKLLDTYKFSGVIGNAVLADSVILNVTLVNVEESYHNFINSFREYEDWQANNEGQTLPSFVTPTSVFSNVNGGVGVFAGTNSITMSAKIK